MAKEVKIDILIDASKSARSLNDLNKSLNDMKAAASELDPVSNEFKKLNAEIINADTKVKNLGKSMSGLDANAKAGEIGKLAGGLSAMGAAAALAFAGDKDAEKFFATFAKGIAITNAVKGTTEAYTSAVELLKDSTIAQSIAQKTAAAAQLIYTTAVGTSTGALKLFRLALIGTGIGAIIVGIGLLIANFDKVSAAVSNAVKQFREMGPVMKAILYPITLAIAAFDGIIFALEKLGVIDDENTKKIKANAEERVINTKKEGDEISARYDLEIRKAAAAGKDVSEIEQEKRRAILENIRLQAEAILAQVKATGEFTDEQKKSLEELKTLAIKTSDDITVAEIGNNKKSLDDYKKTIDEKKKAEKEERDEESAALAKFLVEKEKTENEYLDSQLSKIDRERNAVYDKYFDLIEAAKKNGQDTTILQQAQQAALDEINKKQLDSEKAHQDNAIALGLELKQKRIDAGLNDPDATAEEKLAKYDEQAALDEELYVRAQEALLARKETENLTDAEFAAEKANIDFENEKKITENKRAQADAQKAIDDEKRESIKSNLDQTANVLNSFSELAGKQTAAGKTLAVAAATINTFRGVSDALAATTVTPFETGLKFANAAAIGIAGIANVKKILAVKVPGGGGGSAPSVGSAPAPITPQTTIGNQISASQTEGISSGGPGQNQQTPPPQRVYVLESDITGAQNNVNNIARVSEYG